MSAFNQLTFCLLQTFTASTKEERGRKGALEKGRKESGGGDGRLKGERKSGGKRDDSNANFLCTFSQFLVYCVAEASEDDMCYLIINI